MQDAYSFLKIAVEEIAWELAWTWSVLGSHKCRGEGFTPFQVPVVVGNWYGCLLLNLDPAKRCKIASVGGLRMSRLSLPPSTCEVA